MEATVAVESHQKEVAKCIVLINHFDYVILDIRLDLAKDIPCYLDTKGIICLRLNKNE